MVRDELPAPRVKPSADGALIDAPRVKIVQRWRGPVKAHRGGWTLGYVYWDADGDECFVGLQETPVYATREEAMEEVRLRSRPQDRRTAAPSP